MSQSVAHARRPFSQPVPVEVLEVRTLMSVTNSEGGNVVPAHDLGLYFSPIAHDVGPYYAPHGKAFPGSVAPVTINDVGATSIISGGLPATVSNTPGGGSATYQISVIRASRCTQPRIPTTPTAASASNSLANGSASTQPSMSPASSSDSCRRLLSKLNLSHRHRIALDELCQQNH